MLLAGGVTSKASICRRRARDSDRSAAVASSRAAGVVPGVTSDGASGRRRRRGLQLRLPQVLQRVVRVVLGVGDGARLVLLGGPLGVLFGQPREPLLHGLGLLDRFRLVLGVCRSWGVGARGAGAWRDACQRPRRLLIQAGIVGRVCRPSAFPYRGVVGVHVCEARDRRANSDMGRFRDGARRRPHCVNEGG